MSVWDTAFFPLFLSLSFPFPVSSFTLRFPSPFLFPVLFAFLFRFLFRSFSFRFPFLFLSLSFSNPFPFPFPFLFLSLSFPLRFLFFPFLSVSYSFLSPPLLFLFLFPFLRSCEFFDQGVKPALGKTIRGQTTITFGVWKNHLKGLGVFTRPHVASHGIWWHLMASHGINSSTRLIPRYKASSPPDGEEPALCRLNIYAIFSHYTWIYLVIPNYWSVPANSHSCSCASFAGVRSPPPEPCHAGFLGHYEFHLKGHEALKHPVIVGDSWWLMHF